MLFKNSGVPDANTSPQGRGIYFMKYAFYSSPPDAWLKVPVSELKLLLITDQISSKSYISACGNFAFLDSEKDAQIFIDAVLLADWFENFNALRKYTRYFHTDTPQFITNLDAFTFYREKLLSGNFLKSFEF